MMHTLGSIRILLVKVFAACPYTALGRKCLGFHPTPREPAEITQDDKVERALRSRIVLGRNFVLIGFFCPIFWVSVFNGAELQVVVFNAVHSGIVILIGWGIMLKSKYDMARVRERR